MPRNLLPHFWQTERLSISDSILDEIPELQQINDLVPQTENWMDTEEHEGPLNSMRYALEHGSLPPIPERSKDFFRLQSVRLRASGELIGFLAAYHGFPQEDVFWPNAVTLHPDFQGKGYGTELLRGLCDTVQQLGSYTCLRTYVHLGNLRSLRMCVKAGLNKILEVAEAPEKDRPGETSVHVLLEISFPVS
jgi:RimJ/RimL family protein N-acetyltransferase